MFIKPFSPVIDNEASMSFGLAAVVASNVPEEPSELTNIETIVSSASSLLILLEDFVTTDLLDPTNNLRHLNDELLVDLKLRHPFSKYHANHLHSILGICTILILQMKKLFFPNFFFSNKFFCEYY